MTSTKPDWPGKPRTSNARSVARCCSESWTPWCSVSFKIMGMRYGANRRLLRYLPPSPYSTLRPELAALVRAAWDDSEMPLHIGASWTTDAPFRETEAMVATCHADGILAVEMEAAALYALAAAQQRDIICLRM